MQSFLLFLNVFSVSLMKLENFMLETFGFLLFPLIISYFCGLYRVFFFNENGHF